MRLFAVLARGPALLRTALHSWLWQRVLRVPELHIHHSAQIIGDRYIQVGNRFRAGRLLWLEAVTAYGSQRFTPQLVIGERVNCSDAVHIACIDRVTIGNDVLIGSKVHVTDHNHGIYQGAGKHSSAQMPPVERDLKGRPVHIGARAFLADGVVVLPGSIIGEGCIVGANSVVSGTLPPQTICVGAPARPIKAYDAEQNRWLPLDRPVARASDIEIAS